jgi:hypothetical protein
MPIPAIPFAVKVGVSLAFRELGMWMSRVQDRKRLYEWAEHRSKELGRPLVVIGNPQGGMTHMGYSTGDLCVDLTGCPTAAPGKSVKADITKPGSIPVADDSSVIFVSCVLEYVKDMEKAWNEIIRAAGSPSNVFICHVPKASFTAWLYPGARYVIDSAPPYTPTISYKSTSSEMPVHEVGDSSLKKKYWFGIASYRPYGGTK